MTMTEESRIEEGVDKSSIWLRVLRKVLAMPGARISRADYLKKELSKHFSEQTVKKAIETTPAKAGIPSSVIRSIARSSIKWHRAGVTATSFWMGIPGKWWMIGSIPADLTQFFWHIIVIIQKMAYLHGWPDFLEEGAEPDDETLHIITLFVGVMFGVGSAAKVLADLAERVAAQTLKRLPQQALTKWGFYRLAREIAKWIGIRLTKQGFARVVSKIVPIVSGFASGTITWLWFSGMSRKLHSHLETLRPHIDVGQTESDVALLESDPKTTGRPLQD